MGDIHWSEIVFGSATFVVLTAYHLYWLYQVRRAPLRTYSGVTRHLRRVWVESIIDQKRDILSVQSLRNWIMASSFLASTAMIIGLGLVSFFFKAEHLSEIPFDVTLIFFPMRAFYLAVVVALWLFGPVWMFLGSLILIFVLYRLDHCCALDYSTARCDIEAHGLERDK